MADSYLTAVILGIVEGLTEFLPISSTGHLILAGDLLGYNDEKAKVFDIAIQTGAMLAVVWEYRRRFTQALSGAFSDAAAQRFLLNLIVAFIPAAVVGLAFGALIKQYLFYAVPVATTLVVGGFIILWVDLCVDPRHLALGRHHHRRHAVRALAQSRHRVFVFPRRAHAGGGGRLQSVQAPRAAFGGRHRLFQRRFGDVVYLGLVVHTLVYPLCRLARLHRVRVVSHRLRLAGARHGVFWLGRLGIPMNSR